MKKQKTADISLVIPLFNEEESLPDLADAIRILAPKLAGSLELILVNDGSTDKTSEVAKKSNWGMPLVVLELSRNFGHQSAVLAGLKAATGSMIITLDGDLQHPPSLIPQLIQLCKQGYDVVLTQRIDSVEHVPFHKRLTAKLFYVLLNWLSDTTIPMNTSDFRLLTRPALDALLAMPEHRKFLRGLVNWIGYPTVIVPYEVGKRTAGTSKYSLQKMLQLAFHGVTSFSVIPLYFSGMFSIVLFLSAVMYALYVLYVRFVTQTVVSGWASVLFVLLVLGGFITLFLGLIGFYLAAIYDEVKQRPEYILKSRYEKTT